MVNCLYFQPFFVITSLIPFSLCSNLPLNSQQKSIPGFIMLDIVSTNSCKSVSSSVGSRCAQPSPVKTSQSLAFLGS